MKVKEIAVTVRHSINVGAYESITPSVSMSATLEEHDEPAECLAKLHKQASAVWAEQTLVELSWLRQRRGEDTHEFDQKVVGTKKQLKSML